MTAKRVTGSVRRSGGIDAGGLPAYGDRVFDTDVGWQGADDFLLSKLFHVIGSRLTTEDHAATPQLNRKVSDLTIRALVDLFFEVLNHGNGRVNHVLYCSLPGRPIDGDVWYGPHRPIRTSIVAGEVGLEHRRVSLKCKSDANCRVKNCVPINFGNSGELCV